jgi:hypothetical protein
MIKKILLLISLGTLFLINLRAQDIPNPGFETWVKKGSYEDPEDWGTINQQTSVLGIKTTTKATAADVHSGASALKLITKYIGVPYNQNGPGITATGTINQQTRAIDGGFIYTKRPVSLTGWYKYLPAGKDTASMEVTLSYWDSNAGKRITVGNVKFMDTTTINVYTKFTAPINYSNAASPDSAVIILLSSQENGSVVNSSLFIDDLAFDFTPTGTGSVSPSKEVTVYPNPASEEVLFTNLPAQAAILLIYDLKGSKLSETPLHGNSSKQSLASFRSGIYFYKIIDINGNILKNNKLVIFKSN